MDSIQIREEVTRITGTFGMTAVKAAEIMNISPSNIGHRFRGTKGYYFTEEHLATLKQYIKAKAAEL